MLIQGVASLHDENIFRVFAELFGIQLGLANESATPIDIWQRYASPIWMDISQTNTLQYRTARDSDDERHICPLQLDVIERALFMWSNPGDLVMSPFTGIGSEGYTSLKMGRRFIGAELKPAYFNLAQRNIESAKHHQGGLFDDAPEAA